MTLANTKPRLDALASVACFTMGIYEYLKTPVLNFIMPSKSTIYIFIFKETFKSHENVMSASNTTKACDV